MGKYIVGLMVIFTLSEAVFSSASVTVNVYTVVLSGEAVGFLQSEQLNPALGDQEYDSPSTTGLQPSCICSP